MDKAMKIAVMGAGAVGCCYGGMLARAGHLNGYVLHKGEALGIATPANRVLHTLVKLIEGRSSPEAAA